MRWYNFAEVSIHALLAECDQLKNLKVKLKKGFNPRTPCGVRLYKVHHLDGTCIVSIHALLAECDFSSADSYSRLFSFNPRTPCGVRPWPSAGCWRSWGFQSTHSLRSATMAVRRLLAFLGVSIHALLAECDPLKALTCADRKVSIHALLAECDVRTGNVNV